MFVDPYEEVEEKMKEQEEREREESKAKEAQELANKAGVASEPKVYRAGVGKYIQPAQPNRRKRPGEPAAQPSKKKKSGFGDFSDW